MWDASSRGSIGSKASDFYVCVEDNFEELERVYDDKYQKQHGYPVTGMFHWRPVIRTVVYNYLNRGDLRQSFARVRCAACRAEFLVAFSRKGRYFCPSCHQKRVVAFADRVETELLEKIPHSQYVVTILKMLRVYFKHDRKLLGLLSRSFYQALKEFFREASEGGIYEVDPLACPRCHGLMKIISIIEDPPIIKRILLHLHLWEVPSPPPRSPPRDLDFFSRQTG